jgi:ABC-type sugar transport system permease subunit
MKKVILINGLIAGSIVAAMMFITMPMYESGTLNFDNGELVGYTTMVIALSMVFVGVKSYRDNYANGSISFGKGFKVGILITLIACVMYGLAWEVTYTNIGENLMKKMTEKHFADMKADGATDQELEEAKKQWESFGEMYKNPFFRFLFTALIEMFIPVGLPVTLLSAAVLRKKEILPA